MALAGRDLEFEDRFASGPVAPGHARSGGREKEGELNDGGRGGGRAAREGAETVHSV